MFSYTGLPPAFCLNSLGRTSATSSFRSVWLHGCKPLRTRVKRTSGERQSFAHPLQCKSSGWLQTKGFQAHRFLSLSGPPIACSSKGLCSTAQYFVSPDVAGRFQNFLICTRFRFWKRTQPPNGGIDEAGCFAIRYPLPTHLVRPHGPLQGRTKPKENANPGTMAWQITSPPTNGKLRAMRP